MSLKSYDNARQDFVDLLKRGDLVGARLQLLILRGELAGIPNGSLDGAAYQLRSDDLNDLEAHLDREVQRKRAASNDRVIHTRTSFPTRGLGW